jgi:sarcosine dehydrogenase
VPALETAGVKQMINGPESFTPDGMFILGEAPEQRNLFVGAGFNAFGIASGGGAGMCAGRMGGERARRPSTSGPPTSAASAGPHFDTDWMRNRTYGGLWQALHHRLAWRGTCRSARPAASRRFMRTLTAAGACFGEKLGWERPNWFADPGEPARTIYTYRPPELVGRRWPRTSRGARGGGADRPDLVRQIRLKGPDAAAATCPGSRQ